jgi:transposase
VGGAGVFVAEHSAMAEVSIPACSNAMAAERHRVCGVRFLAARLGQCAVSRHQGRYELREILNSIFYQNRTGCQWAYLPHDLPPKSATWYYFALWREDGTDRVIHDLLRCQARERAAARAPDRDRARHPADPGGEPCAGGHDRQRCWQEGTRGVSAAWPSTCSG